MCNNRENQRTYYDNSNDAIALVIAAQACDCKRDGCGFDSHEG